MDFKRIQDEFDLVKWYDSIVAGEDCCGSYEFCDKCHKDEENPCAHAMQRLEKGYVRVAVVSVRR